MKWTLKPRCNLNKRLQRNLNKWFATMLLGVIYPGTERTIASFGFKSVLAEQERENLEEGTCQEFAIFSFSPLERRHSNRLRPRSFYQAVFWWKRGGISHDRWKTMDFLTNFATPSVSVFQDDINYTCHQKFAGGISWGCFCLRSSQVVTLVLPFQWYSKWPFFWHNLLQ